MSNETTATIDYAIDKLQPVFDKLEVLGTHGWEVAVRQQVIEGIGSIAVWIAVLFVSIAIIKWAMARAKRPDPHNSRDGATRGWMNNLGYTETVRAHTIPFGFAWFVVVVSTLMLLFGGPSTLGKILNPEWAAIHALLQMIGG